ncbi:nucleotidyltransferase domain-containing protein [Nocardia asiatica]|uniref:nucleotidyltransferase domain-containing protein n=1 Tax=Nocardia asiatica TaxID=209252 RepID=UPI003EDED008
MREFPIPPPRDAEEAAFQNLWGPWARVTPADVGEVLGDISAPWWVAGGWAIDAFTGTRREHSDVDVAMFRAELPALRTAARGRLHIWSAGPDGIRPVDDRYPDVADNADQVWLRAGARSPWLIDLLLNPGQDGAWVNRRDPAMVAPLDEVTWIAADGVRYLRPELVLIYKVKQSRPKDRQDLERTWPKLDDAQRTTVRTYISTHYPQHEWLTLLR